MIYLYNKVVILYIRRQQKHNKVSLEVNISFQIGQYTQKTLPHPRRREPDLRLLEPISYASVRNGHNAEIIALVPPQFGDSSPEELSKVMF